MKPIARTDRLIKQMVGTDTLIYDRADDSSCHLNALVSAVWRLSDGTRTVELIATEISREVALPAGTDAEALVWRALAELEEHNLLLVSAGAGAPEEASSGIRRRDVLKAAAAGAFFPGIQKIFAPTSANATSPVATASGTGSLPAASSSSTQAVSQSATKSAGVAVSASVSVSQSVTKTNTPTNSGTATQTASVTRSQAVAGTATKLAFSTAPSSTAQAGVALSTQPVVEVQDNAGNRVTTSTATVTIALTAGSSGTLAGTLAVAAVAGRATFSGLSFSTAGSKSITASSGSLTQVVSGSIVVS